MNEKLIDQTVEAVKGANRVIALTGAGISVESGVPPFRGENGIWAKHDSSCLDLRYFKTHPEEAWKGIREIFYDHFSEAKPNAAHFALARMEEQGLLQGVITQNIDNLHQLAGSKDVVEFHGNSQRLICQDCGESCSADEIDWEKIPPRCKGCGEILKPDFVFFGEGIPGHAFRRASSETLLADVWLVIGTTGEVVPAASLPIEAKRNGKTIIEVNIQPSNYTEEITDIFLQGKATEVMQALIDRL